MQRSGAKAIHRKVDVPWGLGDIPNKHGSARVHEGIACRGYPEFGIIFFIAKRILLKHKEKNSMYRLAEMECPVIQRVVSNELATGILNVFNIDKAVAKLEIDDEGLDTLKTIFDFYSNNTSFHELGTDTLRIIAEKVEKMYEELLDTEYEYTYDEFGEYLLYLFMLYLGDDEDSIYDNYLCSQYKRSSIYINDEIFIRDYYKDYYEMITKESPEMLEEISEKEYVEMHLKNVSVFPYMGFTEYDDESCIFWDVDYLLYDDAGKASILLTDIGMGFVTQVDDREPISGSLKKKIGEDS